MANSPTFVTVGDYEYVPTAESLLGRGAFGEVWRGRHKRRQNEVAVKKLTGVDFTQAQNEIQIAKTFMHPNLVHLLASASDSVAFFIVMELCLMDLTAILKQVGKFAGDDMQLLVQQLASGYKALYDKSILHRDIKPGNILASRVSDSKVVLKLADFGCSKILIGNQLAQTGIGTGRYMAPEVGAICYADGDCSYNYLADFWSLGMVFNQCCGGELIGIMNLMILFGLAADKSRVAELKSASTCAIAEGIDPDLREIISGFLKPHYSDRMTADEFFDLAYVSLPIPRSGIRIKPSTRQQSSAYASAEGSSLLPMQSSESQTPVVTSAKDESAMATATPSNAGISAAAAACTPTLISDDSGTGGLESASDPSVLILNSTEVIPKPVFQFHGWNDDNRFSQLDIAGYNTKSATKKLKAKTARKRSEKKRYSSDHESEDSPTTDAHQCDEFTFGSFAVKEGGSPESTSNSVASVMVPQFPSQQHTGSVQQTFEIANCGEDSLTRDEGNICSPAATEGPYLDDNVDDKNAIVAHTPATNQSDEDCSEDNLMKRAPIDELVNAADKLSVHEREELEATAESTKHVRALWSQRLGDERLSQSTVNPHQRGTTMVRRSTTLPSIFGGGDNRCSICNKTVFAAEEFVVSGTVFHRQCFKCTVCKINLRVETSQMGIDRLPYCKRHYIERFNNLSTNRYTMME